MNQAAMDVLVQAALSGVRQIAHKYRDEHGGLCSLGVLADAAGIDFREEVVTSDDDLFDIALIEKLESTWGLFAGHLLCPVCTGSLEDEAGLIVHLNDFHSWDFLAIARKLGPEVKG